MFHKTALFISQYFISKCFSHVSQFSQWISCVSHDQYHVIKAAEKLRMKSAIKHG